MHIESVITCGGDADTTGAIAGALAGLTVSADGIPGAVTEERYIYIPDRSS